jgi:hypothetical protein
MRVKFLGIFVFFFAIAGQLAAQTQLSLTASPSSLQINQSSAMMISLTNLNVGAPATVQHGDVLELYCYIGWRNCSAYSD